MPATHWPVATVLTAVRAPATDAELSGEAAVVAMFRSQRSARTGGTRRPSRKVKGFVGVSVLVVSSVTGVAAATGNLPAPALVLWCGHRVSYCLAIGRRAARLC